MKLFDYLALVLALTLTVFSFLSALTTQNGSLEILIQADDREWIYPVDSIISTEYEGPVGVTSVRIEDGKVTVPHSDCREQICVQAGSIEKQGQWIACMPNRVFVTIRGKKEGELDGEAY